MLEGLEKDVATLIIEGLNLEVELSEISVDDPIFGEGLGLDSIDALEISLLVSKKFGVTMKQGDERNKEAFSSIRALSRFIQENMAVA